MKEHLQHPRPSRAQIAFWADRPYADKLASSHYFRAKKANGGKPNGYWTGHQWLMLLAAHEFRCFYCGEHLPARELTPDHKVPLSRGGTNTIDNLVPACLSGNKRKARRTTEEYERCQKSPVTKKSTRVSSQK